MKNRIAVLLIGILGALFFSNNAFANCPSYEGQGHISWLDSIPTHQYQVCNDDDEFISEVHSELRYLSDHNINRRIARFIRLSDSILAVDAASKTNGYTWEWVRYRAETNRSLSVLIFLCYQNTLRKVDIGMTCMGNASVNTAVLHKGLPDTNLPVMAAMKCLSKGQLRKHDEYIAGTEFDPAVSRKIIKIISDIEQCAHRNTVYISELRQLYAAQNY